VKLSAAADLPRQSIDVGSILFQLKTSGVGLSIVILDACRNNPFTNLREALGSGLALVENAAGETVVAYSTAAGATAFDGSGLNSPYTSALVSALDVPGKDIYDVFRSVRSRVRESTSGQQLPWVSGSIERSFVFRAPADTAPTDTTDSAYSVESILWETIKSSPDPADFKLLLDSFPTSQFAQTAQEKLRTFESASQSTRVAETPPSAEVDRLSGSDVELAQGITADRVPPEPLRAWPRSLSTALPEGLANIVTRCDFLAGDPDDPARLTPGIGFGVINTRLAIRECAAALAQHPEDPRLLYQLGRALDAAERHREAAFFYRMAGDRNYGSAIVSLGFLYLNGRGVERDPAQAASLYRRAALLGNLRARTNLGELYEKGIGVTKTLEEAVLWYRLAAAGGWPNAIGRLGNLYKDGIYVDKDPVQAIELYRLSADLGNTNSMNSLGRMYEQGLGTPKDLRTSLGWYETANSLGNRFAAYNLGRLCRRGIGVEKNAETALKYFELAADRGFGEAHLQAGEIYELGELGKIDLKRAVYHYWLAKLSKEEAAQAKLDALQGRVGRDDYETARRQAEEWWQQNGW
jgi:TPR repeat protein